jgi:hypothetical protein
VVVGDGVAALPERLIAVLRTCFDGSPYPLYEKSFRL